MGIQKPARILVVGLLTSTILNSLMNSCESNLYKPTASGGRRCYPPGVQPLLGCFTTERKPVLRGHRCWFPVIETHPLRCAGEEVEPHALIITMVMKGLGCAVRFKPCKLGLDPPSLLRWASGVLQMFSYALHWSSLRKNDPSLPC